MEHESESFSVQEISEHFGFTGSKDFKILVKQLADLEDSGKIVLTRQGKFGFNQKNRTLEGTFRLNDKGFGFVTVEEGKPDIFIPRTDVHGAMDGDTVAIRIVQEENPYNDKAASGTIVKIVERAVKQVVGIYTRYPSKIMMQTGYCGEIALKDSKLKKTKCYVTRKGLNPVDGTVVIAEVEQYETERHELVLKAHIVKEIGYKDAVGMDILMILHQLKIPTVFPATTGDGVTLKNAGDASSVYEYIYRVCFSDSYQGVVGANFVNKKFGKAKVAILQDTGNDYSKGLADAFEKTYTDSKIGGSVVAREYYQSKDTDFQAVLTTLKSKTFDVLYVPGYYEEVGLIIKQAREMGITQPIVGGDGLSSDKLAALAGNSANLSNVYYTSHFSTLSKDSDVQEFVKAYKEKFGANPDTFAALSYDATQLLMKAIEKAGSTDPQAITKALAETTDFDGVTGTFSMGADHTPIKSAVVIEFQNGQEVNAQEYSAE